MAWHTQTGISCDWKNTGATVEVRFTSVGNMTAVALFSGAKNREKGVVMVGTRLAEVARLLLLVAGAGVRVVVAGVVDGAFGSVGR